MAEVFDFGLQQHKIKMDGKFFENNLFAVAGDTGRRLEVQLLDSNNTVQNTNGISLRLNANVADQATYAEATLVDATKGLYELDLPNGMLIAPGNWQFQWQIIGTSGEKLHSFAFTGSVGSNLSEGGSEATNFYLNADELKQMQDDLINGTFDSEVLETNIAEKLNNLEEQYAPRLTEVSAQLAQTKRKITTHWTPPSMEGANLNLSYEEFITQNYERLRTKFSSNISHEVITNDSLGNPIYGYIFEPDAYTKTVTLTAGIHGNEPESYWGLYYLMSQIYENNIDNEKLKEVRDKVRIALIPVVSPSGYESFTRENSNGINLNRNFNVNFNEKAGNSEGEPFSEKEAQAVRDFIGRYAKESDFHLDFHTVPPFYREAGTHAGYSYVKPYSKLWEPMHSIQEYMVRYWNEEFDKNLNSLYQQSTSSNITNYMQEVLGVPAATLEFASLNFGKLADSKEMTEAVKWYGNVFLHLACEFTEIKSNNGFEKVENSPRSITIDLASKKEVYSIRLDSLSSRVIKIINVVGYQEKYAKFKIRLINEGGASLSFEDKVTWVGGVPDLSGNILIELETYDGGFSYYGKYDVLNLWSMTEEFDRPNTTNDTGSILETLTGRIGILDNHAYSNLDATSLGVVDTKTPDAYINMNFKYFGSTGIAFRVKDSSSYMAVYLVDDGLKLYKFGTRLGDVLITTHAYAPTQGEEINLRVITFGHEIWIYLNGSLVISSSEVYNSTETKHGLRLRIANKAVVKNITFKPYM